MDIITLEDAAELLGKELMPNTETLVKEVSANFEDLKIHVIVGSQDTANTIEARYKEYRGYPVVVEIASGNPVFLSKMEQISVEEAGRLLGRELVGIPHIVGVSLRHNAGIPGLNLFVDIDDEEPRAYLEQNYPTYKGYRVHIRKGSAPKFAKTK